MLLGHLRQHHLEFNCFANSGPELSPHPVAMLVYFFVVVLVFLGFFGGVGQGLFFMVGFF